MRETPGERKDWKGLLVTEFTQFKAVLLFCKQHHKYFNTVMQHYIVSIMNLSTWFISTHAKVWDHKPSSSSKRVWNVNTSINELLFIIFTLSGLQGLHNRLEHVHDPEHVVKVLRLHWNADFKGFKGFLSLSLTGLKLWMHNHVFRISIKGKIYKLTFIFWN